MSRMSDLQIEQAELFADTLNRDFGDCEDDRPFGELLAAVQTFIVMNPTYDHATLREFLHFIQNDAGLANWEYITTKSRRIEEEREAEVHQDQLNDPAWQAAQAEAAKENDWADPVVLHCGCQVGINRSNGAEATLLCKEHAQVGTKTNEELEAESARGDR
jgi:hypothetical protein